MDDENVTPEFIRKALDEADLNALRLALYQATGDGELAAMRVLNQPIRGGAFKATVLAPEDQERVKEKALAHLLTPANRGDTTSKPDPDELRRLIELFRDRQLSDREFALDRREVAFDDFPHDARWKDRPPAALAGFRVIIIGAGASGIALSAKLSRLGIGHTVLERQSDLAGTWHRQRYPNVRVDTNFLQYQFKWAKKYEFEEYYPKQSDIKAYMTHVAKEHRVDERVRFDQAAVEATWDEATSTWEVVAENSAKERTHYSANVVVSATGLFTTPKIPDFPGAETFQGTITHTADWPQGLDYAGKRVGVIGNGSTGAQVLPKLAQDAAHTTLFQRTPSWIAESPTATGPVSPETRWLFRNMPNYWNWTGYSQYVLTLEIEKSHSYDAEWQAEGGRVNAINDSVRAALTDYIQRKVGHDEFLLANLVPDYAPLARRLVIDGGFYDALTRDNVSLNVDGIREIVPDGVITGAGEHVPLDILVVAAGYEVNRYFWPTEYHGAEGRTFDELWAEDGARAYLGMAYPGFPNFYSVYGPNGQGRGAGGFLLYVDIWTYYVAAILVQQIEAGCRRLEVREEVYDEYNVLVDEREKQLFYSVEAKGGYWLNDHGRSGVQMPWGLHEYYDLLLPPRLSDYQAD